MSDDDVFRLAMIRLCLVFMPIGLYYRIRSYTGEKIDRWQEGAVALVGLRLTAAVLFGGGIAWLINPQWMAWSSIAIPVGIRWAGLVAWLGSACLWVWAVHHLGKNLTDTVVARQEHTLVTTGPYRWVRHPFYTACAIGLVGGGLVMANWFILLTGAGTWCAFILPRTRIEEDNLAARFGNEYRSLMNRTGRFLPRWRK